jgi:hypothetical protein
LPSDLTRPGSFPFSGLSPRSRRKLRRLGVVLAFAAVVGLVIALLPAYSGKRVNHFTKAPVQRVHAEPEVTLNGADRRAIATLLTRFVIDVIERKDPVAGLALAGPPLRASTTRAQWARGEVPVYPYDASGTDFSRSWRVDAAYRSHVDIELDLQPSAKSTIGPIAFSGVLRRRDGRWQVDSMYPQAIYPK